MKLGTKILLGFSILFMSPIIVIGGGAFASLGIYCLIEKDDANPLVAFFIAMGFELAWLVGFGLLLG